MHRTRTRIRFQTCLAFCLATIVLLVAASPQSYAQNSSKKIRVVPNAIASKIGTAIKWQTDFDVARKLSVESSKPIFWYPPRLAQTFMDRKKEIDRYMRAGPFSNPIIIASINENYIPLMAIPNKKQSAAYDLKPFVFIEPGFLVIESDGSKSLMLDRLTTLNSSWLAGFLKPPSTPINVSDQLAMARELFAAAKYRDVLELPADANTDVELELFKAMSLFRTNQHVAALQKFEQISTAFPDHPLGWKAAAEAQQFGPFVRGFETYRQLPPLAMLAGRKSAGSAAPAKTYTQPQLWNRGVEYLLSMQHENGSFRDSDYDYGGTDGLPNVHAAVTAIAAMALLEALERPEFADQKARMETAIEKAAAWVGDDANLNPQDSDEIFWAYLFRLRLFNRLHAKSGTSLSDVSRCLKSLEGIQTAGGNWYHEYNNPFVTASALWAMKESQLLGANVSASSVEAGTAALKKCRYANGAFSYSAARGEQTFADNEARPRQVIGSAGRVPLCEGALYIWEQSSDAALAESLKMALADHDSMAQALKYDDHTAPYSYGGFFYWYCMQARSETILKVTDPQQRTELAAKQREIIMSNPELDGCFVDSHEIGRCYGTAMALLSLKDCQRATQADPNQ